MDVNGEMRIIGRALLKVALFFIIVILGVLLIINSFAYSLKIQFNEFLLGTLAQFLGIIFASFIAFYLFEKGKIESRKGYIQNQIKILEGIFNELLILNGEGLEIYGGQITKGNLDALKNKENIGHDVNHIQFQEYVTQFDQSLLRLINVGKLIRTLSYINDKITIINDLGRKNIKWMEVIFEAHGIVQNLKTILSIQIKELKKELKNI